MNNRNDYNFFSSQKAPGSSPAPGPVYENVDLSQCPPPLHPKTPISPPNNISPEHSKINHPFSFDEGKFILILLNI